MPDTDSPGKINDAQALAWIADVLRTQGVASRPPGGDMGALVRALEQWGEHLQAGSDDQPGAENNRLRWLDSMGVLDTEVSYEPRCLAVSPNGTRVAVGTKAGTLHYASVDPRQPGGTCNWDFTQLGDPQPVKTLEESRDKSHVRRRAIRLLGFIDEDHILVGGGRFRVWNIADKSNPRDIPVEQFTDSAPDTDGAETEQTSATKEWFDQQYQNKYPDTWFERSESWIPLIRPGQRIEPGAGEEEPVGVAITAGENLCLLTVRRGPKKPKGKWQPTFKWQKLRPKQIFEVTHVGRCDDRVPRHAQSSDAGDDVPRHAQSESSDTEDDVPPGFGETFGRLVGGVFWRWAIWLLTEKGCLYRYEPPANKGWQRGEKLPLHRVFDGRRTQPSEDGQPPTYHAHHWVRKIPRAPGRPRFTRLRAAWDGLGVQAGAYVTVLGSNLPTGRPLEQDERSKHQPIFTNPIWQHLPDVTDFMLFRAFINGEHDAPPNSFEPLWLLANREKQSGLSWLMWVSATPREPKPKNQAWGPDYPHPGLRPTPRGPIPSASATAPGEVLALAHGAQRVDWNQSPRGTTPCFLVMGTRDHRLRIASLIHTRRAEELLLRHIDQWPETSNSPGMRRLVAKRRLLEECGLSPIYLIEDPALSRRHDQFKRFPPAVQKLLEPPILKPSPLEPPEPQQTLDAGDQPAAVVETDLRAEWDKAAVSPAWLENLTWTDLRDLAQLLVGRVLRTTRARFEPSKPSSKPLAVWESSHPSTREDRRREAARFIDRFQYLVLNLVRRTVELDDDPEYRLRHELATLIVRGIERWAVGWLSELRLLGEMLRKWVRLGETYDTKARSHIGLAHWNVEGRRDLDALAYCVRVLQRRVDLLSSSRPAVSDTPAAWALAVDDSHAPGLVIQAHHDGRLTAVDRLGSTLRWVSEADSWKADYDELSSTGSPPSTVPLGAPQQPDHATESPSDWVEPWYTKNYKYVYWNGPYARSLSLSALDDTGTQFGLFFVTKGFRKRESGPSLEAVAFALHLELNAGKRTLTVVKGVYRRAGSEVYSLLKRPLDARGPLIVGLRGTPVGLSPSRDGQADPVRWSIASCAPIFERDPDSETGWDIRIADENQPVFTAPGEPWRRDRLRIGQEANDPIGTYNPSWALAHWSQSLPEGGCMEFVWAGLDDGSIEVFMRVITDTAGADSVEWARRPGLAPPRRTAKITCMEVGASLPSADDGMVVFVGCGTSAGEISVWGWNLESGELLADRNKPSGARAPAPIHLIHTRERTEIVLLSLYQDESPRPDERAGPVPLRDEDLMAQRLIAVTQGGVVSIFDLDIGTSRQADGAPASVGSAESSTSAPAVGDDVPPTPKQPPIQARLQVLSGRRWPSGARIDHFRLHTDVRVAALSRSPPPSDEWTAQQRALLADKLAPPPPELIVADSRGEVRRYGLVAPKQTGRRKRLMRIARTVFDVAALQPPRDSAIEPNSDEPFRSLWNVEDRCLSNVFGVAAAVGPTRVWAWLQVQDTKSLALTRYSLWMMVHHSGESVRHELRAEQWDQVEFHRQFQAHSLFVEQLGQSVHRGRPVSKEPVKILWQNAGQLANQIAQRALIEPPKSARKKLLMQYYQQLNESLEAMCNRWTGAPPAVETAVRMHSFSVLFDWPDVLILCEPERTEEVKSVQQHLLRHLVQERLHHDDLLVGLEAMRVINLAITRALDQICRRDSPLVTACGDRNQYGPGGVLPKKGFSELLVMVGGLVERRQVQLDSTSPIYTEISRFFARALLLFPSSALAIAMFATEYGLMDRHQSVVAGVAAQAEHVQRQLQQEFHGVEVPAEVWTGATKRFRAYLGFESVEDVPKEESIHYSDRDINFELGLLQVARAQLEKLDPDAINASISFQRKGGIRYFAHSEELLQRLHEQRKEVSARFMDLIRFGGDRERRQQLLDQAIDRARKQIEGDGDSGNFSIFEPQRKHYLKVVDKWAFEVRARGAGFAELLALLDRYSRHVHRAEADRFLTALTELVMQEHPMHPGRSWRELSFPALLDRHLVTHPVWREVYALAHRVVDHANLQSALLWAATTAVGLVSEGAPLAVGNIDLAELEGKFEHAAKTKGIEVRSFGIKARTQQSQRQMVSGYPEVWDLICTEIVTDVRDYASPLSGKPPTLFLHYFELGAARCPGLAIRSSEPYRPDRPEDPVTDVKERLQAVRNHGTGKGFGIDMMTTLCRLSALDFDVAPLPRATDGVPDIMGEIVGWRSDLAKEEILRAHLASVEENARYFTYLVVASDAKDSQT